MTKQIKDELVSLTVEEYRELLEAKEIIDAMLEIGKSFETEESITE